jgi:hypothetical protein
MTKEQQIEMLKQLRAPFPADRIEWRLQSSGEKQDGSIWAKCLCYIDNRAAMERLDEVFGTCWSHSEEFIQIGNQAVCTVTITIEYMNGEEGRPLFPHRSVSGSCAVEANGDIDPFKSAASGAMKRAVVNLGIGRYLYELPEAWAIITNDGKYEGKTKNQTRFRWNPPSLPAWAGGDGAESPAPAQRSYQAPVASAPAPAPVESDGTWRTVVIPFGKQKGQTLGQLPPASLKWWRENYQPKPYNGKISAKDKAFRDALDQSAGAYAPMPGLPTASTDEVVTDNPIDDVPF